MLDLSTDNSPDVFIVHSIPCQTDHSIFIIEILRAFDTLQIERANLFDLIITLRPERPLHTLPFVHEPAARTLTPHFDFFKRFPESFAHKQMKVAVDERRSTFPASHPLATSSKIDGFSDLPTPTQTSSNSSLGSVSAILYVVTSTVPPPQSQIRTTSPT